MNYLSAINCSIDAGIASLKYFKNEKLKVSLKKDQSPLTIADQESHQILFHKLSDYTIPVLSEEGIIPDYVERNKWIEYWLIDPLDGTKEFVNGSGEFTINVAHMIKNIPSFGIIYWPVEDILYFGGINLGSFRKIRASEQLFASMDDLMLHSDKLSKSDELTKEYKVLASKSHMSEETKLYVANLHTKHKNISLVNIGSSLKFCMMAEGKANEYPRFGPTMEWDIAAGNALLKGINIEVVDYKTGKPIRYNKKDLTNNWFIVKN